MSRLPAWREWESGEGWAVRLLRAGVLALLSIFLLFAGAVEMRWPQQAILAATLIAGVFLVNRSRSFLVTLALIPLSCFATFRYGLWRLRTAVRLFHAPGRHPEWIDVFFVVLVLGAEMYAFLVLLLGYLQTVSPLRRAPVPMGNDPSLWPEVDLLIPTFDEPLSVVKYTALAALNIDWPAEKLNVYLLDDGRREEFREFAQEAGLGYMTREDNEGAKAGNINRALERLSAPFVAVFDADHVPTRSFLQLTMGWFDRDPKLAVLQTPHHFYSSDPFERNLFERNLEPLGGGPKENELFHEVVQDGNDFWNAAFFCGSCAVLRREALDAVGGIAVETVTEDAHTSLRMQMRGWNTAYINIPQAAGLATERLSGHIRQRIRWARGMVQVLRTDNPLLVRGLSLAQRLCYFNAMVHFLYALPRLVFLTAPLAYLLLGKMTIPGYWAAILAYALPHLVLAGTVNGRLQGRHRRAFWNEIYETVLAPYTLGPALLALVDPRRGRWEVTAKGGTVGRTFFDRKTALPFLVLLAMNGLGLLAAVPRLFQFPRWTGHGVWAGHPAFDALLAVPAGLYDRGHAGIIAVNLLWTMFNVGLLGVATAVAWEQQQRRQTVRVAMAVPAGVVLSDGSSVQGLTADLSSGGVMVRTSVRVRAAEGDAVQVVLPVLDGDAMLSATVVDVEDRVLRAHFDELTLGEEEALAMVLYSRADTWIGNKDVLAGERPHTSLWGIVRLAARGIFFIGGTRGDRRETRSGGRDSRKRERLANSVVPLLALAALLLLPRAGGNDARAQSPTAGQPATGKQGSEAARPATGGAQATQDETPRAAVQESTTPRRHSAEITSAEPVVEASNPPSPDNDLRLLPAPFLAPTAANGQTLVNLAFPVQPSLRALQAAAIVASWLGVSSALPVRFAVTVGGLPAGNAIVLSEGAGSLPGELGVAEGAGPAIAMHANPADSSAKLLVLSGDGGDELLAVAKVLASKGKLLPADTVKGSRSASPARREPDGAPRWLDTAFPIRLDSMVSKTGLRLGNDGNVKVLARLPPDLYFGTQESVPLHLRYRYGGSLGAGGATLAVSVNGNPVGSIPLEAAVNGYGDALFDIPVADLRPFRNALTAHFQPGASGQGDATGALLGSSTLDLSGAAHWARLPDLQLFAAAGFPFTRRADLSDTAVVLPTSPTPEEIVVFLTLMAHFGAATGVPVLGVEISTAAGMKAAVKNLLVVGTAGHFPGIGQLSGDLPVQTDGLSMGELRPVLRQPWWRFPRRAELDASDSTEGRRSAPNALLEEAEWPRGSGRTAVMVLLGDAAATPGFVNALLSTRGDFGSGSGMAGAASVLRRGVFVGVVTPAGRRRPAAYYVGSLPWPERTNLLLDEFPWLVVAAAFALCFVAAGALRGMLRRHARQRLA